MSSKKKQTLVEQNNLESKNQIPSEGFVLPKWWPAIFMILAFVLYGNTLGHKYTQDDAIVIYDNMYTTKGLAGISGLLTKDTFFGFFKEAGKEKLVAGGRYRPLTPVLFAIEYQFFKNNPFFGHLFNVLWYGFLGIMIFYMLRLLLGKDEKSTWLAMIASCLYLSHPIHTEAVANIKGRDEIIAMLGAISAMYYVLKWHDGQSSKNAWYACLCFFAGLMSKENTITFLAVVPLALMLFRSEDLGKVVRSISPLLLASIIFLIIRFSVLGFDTGGSPMELMNNPFIKLKGASYVAFSTAEKMATIVFTLGKYVQLLIVPMNLTHDYYPRHIDIMNFGDIKVWMSLVLYFIMIGASFYFWKRNRIVSFSLLFYLLTLSIVSNIVFPIGTNMSERFVFMPSLGFSLLLAYFIQKISLEKKHMLFTFFAIVMVAYAGRTIARNMVWKNDFTLFTTDVHTSQNSAKMLNAAGGALVTEAAKEKDESKKTKMLADAEKYLSKAVTIHPGYKNAFLLLGNAKFYLNKKEEAAKAYENALQLDSEFKDAKNNLSVCYRDLGRLYGEQKKDYSQAQKYLLRSFELNSGDVETINYLGITYGMQGNTEEAIKYFTRSTELDPKSPGAFENLAHALRAVGKTKEAQTMMAKAEALKASIKK